VGEGVAGVNQRITPPQLAAAAMTRAVATPCNRRLVKKLMSLGTATAVSAAASSEGHGAQVCARVDSACAPEIDTVSVKEGRPAPLPLLRRLRGNQLLSGQALLLHPELQDGVDRENTITTDGWIGAWHSLGLSMVYTTDRESQMHYNIAARSVQTIWRGKVGRRVVKNLRPNVYATK
jgi:hypothetical protein